MTVIDISLPIYQDMITYPSNPSPKFEQSESGQLTKISVGSHTGTHIDTGRHQTKDSWGVDRIVPEVVIGECRVLDVTGESEKITKQTLKPHKIQPNERILLKSNNSNRDFDVFREDYVSVDYDAAEFLSGLPVTLFGFDYLSIKKFGDKKPDPHGPLLSRGIPILEGINLDKVSSGRYTLIALPLKFGNIDGSPVRAVLIKGEFKA